MVKFENDRYIIEVNTGTNPIEDWLELIKEMLYLTRVVNPEQCQEPPWRTIQFIEEMLPDHNTALKMNPSDK